MTPTAEDAGRPALPEHLPGRSAVGIRARNRAAIEAEILVVAKERLAKEGAAALSLRSIARDLGMASSALYRYVDSRDDLLTRLIISAYDSLADRVDARLAQAPRAKAREQFKIIGRALREWALESPHEFALIYGSPVPDYQAPAEQTNASGTRVSARLFALLPEFEVPGRKVPRAVASALAPFVGEAEALGLHPDPGLALRGLTAWALVMGAVTAEVFQQYGPDAIADPAALFEAQLELALQLLN